MWAQRCCAAPRWPRRASGAAPSAAGAGTSSGPSRAAGLGADLPSVRADERDDLYLVELLQFEQVPPSRHRDRGIVLRPWREDHFGGIAAGPLPPVARPGGVVGVLVGDPDARGPSVAAPPSPGPFWPSLPPLKISRTVSLASMIVRSAVKRSTYVDSVTLMLVQKEVRQQPGVTEAGLVVATDANRTLLRDAGLLSPEAEAAGPDDLVISVSGTSDTAVAAALALAEQLLTQRRHPTAAGEYRPRTIVAACRMLPDATIAAISVPGRFAAAVAREALQEGLHVFLFSDNVPLEDELALKRMAAEYGRLLMGPDCGTALVGGVGLGFANKVRRGSVGIVAAAGTGLQEVSTLIHRFGGGVSQGIGTGGRDVSQTVGGMTMLQGLAPPAPGPPATGGVVVAKPPYPSVAARILGAAQRAGKPVVACFVGSRVESRGRVVGAGTLEDAALTAVRL